MTVHHPHLDVIAKQIRHVADILDDEGHRAVQRAAILAARGYPASTGGGPRSSDTTSSTERAALDPHPWAALDETLAKHLRVIWHASLRLAETIIQVNSHAPDNDELPPGTGVCKACGLLVRPTAKRPNHRIVTGLCPADYRAWDRWRKQYPACTMDQFLFARWQAVNPDGTTDQYLTWRRKIIDAA